MEGPYECAWDLSVDPWEAKEYPMLKIVIIDLKTDCSKRSRVWITEGGQKRGTYTCGRQPIQEYIARSGKVTVGVDVAMNSQVLVSFQAVKGPTPKGMSTHHWSQQYNTYPLMHHLAVRDKVINLSF